MESSSLLLLKKLPTESSESLWEIQNLRPCPESQSESVFEQNPQMFSMHINF